MGRSKSKKKASESQPSAAAAAAAESKETVELSPGGRAESGSVAGSAGSGASGESVDFDTLPTESFHYTEAFKSILTAISSGPVSVAVKAFKDKLNVLYAAFTYEPEDSDDYCCVPEGAGVQVLAGTPIVPGDFLGAQAAHLDSLARITVIPSSLFSQYPNSISTTHFTAFHLHKVQ